LLRVYLEERGARAPTATRLAIHPNTVSNRVRACEALIGRPLGERPVELQVALALAHTIGV
jgi:DNA-binding PucR family transcriptional regulator